MVVVVNSPEAASRARRALPATLDGTAVEIQVGEPMTFH
jgi:hypothetical protein